MKYKGIFIARIPNDEHAEQRIAAYKAEHGQLRMYGRHKDRKGAMRAAGYTLNTHGDLPWRLGTEIVIYRGESGMTYREFQNLQIGDIVRTMGYWGALRKRQVCVVLDKQGKNRIQVQLNNRIQWLKRQDFEILET